MKIALVVHDLHNHGGHARYTRELASAFTENHEVTVFSNTFENPGETAWHQVPVWALRQRAVLTVASFPVGISRHAKALEKFDVVHSQGYCGVLDGVTTAHMCVASFGAAIHSPTLINRASFNLQEALERRFYQNFEGEIIAVSHKTARDLRTHYDVQRPIHVIHHAVDSNRFTPDLRPAARNRIRKQHGINNDELVALYVGDITKAHTSLRTLAARCPDIKLLIVTASTRYRWQASNVLFAAHTRQVEHYYAAADSVVFPTMHDSFGMVVLEAMASGLPVICSDQAGASELITHGKDGYVFGLDDWVENAQMTLYRREELVAVGSAARALATSHDWNSVAQRTEKIYQRVR